MVSLRALILQVGACTPLLGNLRGSVLVASGCFSVLVIWVI